LLVQSKVCKRCGRERPAEAYYRNSRCSDGLHSWCIECKQADAKRKYRALTPMQKKVLAEKAVAKYHRDIEHSRRLAREWRRRNRGAVNARAKELRPGWKKWTKAPEYRRAVALRYRKRHPDKVLAYRERYRAAFPDKYATWSRNRRARARAASGSHTVADVRHLFVLQKGRCAACDRKLARYHVDHIRAVARGGTNDRQNLQILCSPCNHAKHAKDSIVFMQERGFLL